MSFRFKSERELHCALKGALIKNGCGHIRILARLPDVEGVSERVYRSMGALCLERLAVFFMAATLKTDGFKSHPLHSMFSQCIIRFLFTEAECFAV